MDEQDKLWIISEESFDPRKQHHKETVFTIGNGYLSTRGVFEEGYPADRRATFIHGVFDSAPIVYTELANAPDWLPFSVFLDEEQFSMTNGSLLSYQRWLDLQNGVLTRKIHWESPMGRSATLLFERFASLADPHNLLIRCTVIPGFDGTIEARASIKGDTDNAGLAHWRWINQEKQGAGVLLHNRTRNSKIDLATAMKLQVVEGDQLNTAFWDVENTPTLTLQAHANTGIPLVFEKWVAVATSRESDDVRRDAWSHLEAIQSWQHAFQRNRDAWQQEWDHTDVVIEGDDESQLALRFNLFHLLIAAPRQDERVNIGAKSLSGFGYRGHSFWDTEIFMLPVFTYTAPHIAKNLLNYRYHNLPGARKKAQANGFEGAQFPWESAESGEEVTPSWVPHFADPARLVRIWTGDIEIHISADIAYAAYQYWQATANNAWMVSKGAELILDTAKFWASRTEWNEALARYEFKGVIGPDEYHEHVDNNAFTNCMAQWNLTVALEILEWLQQNAPEKAVQLVSELDLSEARLSHWREVVARLLIPCLPTGLFEEFEGYFLRQEVDLETLEPRTKSVQEIFGIEGTNQTQVIKQPDVLMLLHLLRHQYPLDVVHTNYDYYTPRTDHTYGSSLGPSIQAIMACEVGKPDDAYRHFVRAAFVDLYDLRGNTGDGIHAASAGGAWQAVVFGFGGLKITPSGWSVTPRLPSHWKRLRFKFFYQNEIQVIDLQSMEDE